MSSDPDTQTSDLQSNWRIFSNRHANHEFLAVDPLLSIEAELLEQFKAAMPTVVTEFDERFETDLRETTQFGFFFGSGVQKTTPLFWRRHQNSSQKIDEMLREELLRDGHSASEIKEHFASDSKRSAAVEQVREAYCGWLLFNPEYQLELAELKKYSAIVEGLGRIPTSAELPPLGIPETTREKKPSIRDVILKPRSIDQESLLDHVRLLAPDAGEDFLMRLKNFYEKWELAMLVHWDIPAPQSPAYRVPVIYSESVLHPKGVTFSFPWYLVRSQRLTLAEMLSDEIEFAAPPHLREWLKLLHAMKGQPGTTTYERLAKLHQLFYLTLLPRYGTRAGFRKSKTERVLAEHLKVKDETVRKDLQNLGRMMRSRRSNPLDRN